MAYTRLRRVKDTYKFIREMSRKGAASLERTQSKYVAITYGLEPSLIRKMKARFRNELSFSGEGK